MPLTRLDYINIDSIIPSLKSNNDQNYIVASSSIYSGTFDHWKAFNRTNIDSSDCWVSGNNLPLPQWIQIQVPTPKYVYEYSLTSRITASYPPKSWILESSMDGLEYTVIDYVVEDTNWGSNETRTYKVDTPILGKYFKLTVTDKFGGTYVAIGKITFYGKSNQCMIKHSSGYYTRYNNEWVLVDKPYSAEALLNCGFDICELLRIKDWNYFNSEIEIIYMSDSDSYTNNIVLETNTSIPYSKTLDISSYYPFEVPPPTDTNKLIIDNVNINNIDINSKKDILVSSYSSDITSISSEVTIEGSVKTITRYLISIDGGITWYTYNMSTSIWYIVDYSSILENGMSKDEINSLTSSDYKLLVSGSIYTNELIISAGYYNKNNKLDIFTKNIEVEFVENKPPLILDYNVSPDSIHNEFAMVTAKLKDFEGDWLKYRVLIKKANSAKDVSIISALSSNTDKGHEVSASSQYDMVNYFPWKAFNGITNGGATDCWATQNNSPLPQWLQIKLPEMKSIEGYSISVRDYTTFDAPSSWILEGSIDGINWTVIDSRTDIINWKSGETRTFKTHLIYEALYFRITVYKKEGPNGWFNISELKLFESQFYISDEWAEVAANSDVVRAYNYPYFNIGSNIVRIEVKDERGLTAILEQNLILTNSKPLISYTYNAFRVECVISDPDSDELSLQISINNEVVLPFTEYMITPKLFKYEWDNGIMKVGENNIISITIKDKFGAIHTETFGVVGEYKNILFYDQYNDLYSTGNGNILKTLDIGTVKHPNQIDPKKVKFKNNTGQTLDSIYISTIMQSIVPDNIEVELSESNEPFTPRKSITIVNPMIHGEEKEIFIKVNMKEGRGIENTKVGIMASGKIL